MRNIVTIFCIMVFSLVFVNCDNFVYAKDNLRKKSYSSQKVKNQKNVQKSKKRSLAPPDNISPECKGKEQWCGDLEQALQDIAEFKKKLEAK